MFSSYAIQIISSMAFHKHGCAIGPKRPVNFLGDTSRPAGHYHVLRLGDIKGLHLCSDGEHIHENFIRGEKTLMSATRRIFKRGHQAHYRSHGLATNPQPCSFQTWNDHTCGLEQYGLAHQRRTWTNEKGTIGDVGAAKRVIACPLVGFGKALTFKMGNSL